MARVSSASKGALDELGCVCAYLEWVVLQQALLDICRQESASIISREAESHLCKIVCAEREEFRVLCDSACSNR